MTNEELAEQLTAVITKETTRLENEIGALRTTVTCMGQDLKGFKQETANNFKQMNERINKLDQKVDEIDKKFEHKIDRIDKKLDFNLSAAYNTMHTITDSTGKSISKIHERLNSK